MPTVLEYNLEDKLVLIMGELTMIGYDTYDSDYVETIPEEQKKEWSSLRDQLLKTATDIHKYLKTVDGVVESRNYKLVGMKLPEEVIGQTF